MRTIRVSKAVKRDLCGITIGAALAASSALFAIQSFPAIYETKWYGMYARAASTKSEEGLRTMAQRVARKHHLNEELFTSLIEVESGFNPDARSAKGAMGLAQLMPFWAKELGFTHVSELWAPYENLNAGALILKGYIKDQNGDVEKALQAYNGGEKCVGKCPESVEHSKKILQKFANKILGKR